MLKDATCCVSLGMKLKLGTFFLGWSRLTEIIQSTLNPEYTHTHTQIRNILLYIIIHVLQALCVIEMRVNQFSSIEDEKKYNLYFSKIQS